MGKKTHFKCNKVYIILNITILEPQNSFKSEQWKITCKIVTQIRYLLKYCFFLEMQLLPTIRAPQVNKSFKLDCTTGPL